MARRRSADFLERLYNAALAVFARRGLKQARMSDIAREMGVAQGSIYNYVKSKEALFSWLVDLGITPPGPGLPDDLPIRGKPLEQLATRLRAQIGRVFALPKLTAALSRPQPSDIAREWTEIVDELYDRTYASRLQADAIERSARDIPELFRVFYAGVRRSLVNDLARYIEGRSASGYFVQVTDAVVAARFVIETVTFFARHRFNDPDLPPGDEAHVRRTVVGLLERSLSNPEPTRRRQRDRVSY